MQAIWKRLYNTKSFSDYGSLYQLRNLINRRNVVSNPMDDVNACDDFFNTVVTCYVLVACMQMLGMDCLTDVPNVEEFSFTTDSWMKPDYSRRSEIYAFCQDFVDKHVDFSFKTVVERSQDDITNYANDVISLGLFYSNYKDAVKEGNGDRVKTCWKYLIPIFKASDKRNYSSEALRMLYSYYYTLSPRQAQQMLYSRFVNVYGVPGRNIAGDLHMEHLNRACKEAIKGLGANKTEKSITRIGKAIGPLTTITSNFDQNVIGKMCKSSRRVVPSADKDKELIITELTGRACVFEEKAGRQYAHCSKLHKSILSKLDHGTLKEWIEETISSWK